jgi:hypothetical protein
MALARVIITLMISFAVWVSFTASAQTADPAQRGLTFMALPDPDNSSLGITLMTCGKNEDKSNICNPYLGDSLCQSERPLLCIIDINAPAPAYLSTPEYWTGGLIAGTDPVRGDRFSTIQEANSYCSQIFGKNWRVASFHDGGGWAMRAYGSIGNVQQRVWIDIKNQPEGPCWMR